ncbi:hypothetical protein F1880_003860 [Penicillium rolfsii]|nr:hypothetical protein F1880_003860 [Penicillium rolfsii]
MALASKYHLRSEAGWTVWIGHIQAVAQIKNIWQYVDPSLPDESILKLPDLPPAPIRPDRPLIDQASLDDWKRHEKLLDKYTRLQAERSRKLHRREHVRASLHSLNILISRTVSPSLRTLLIPEQSPRDNLRRLARVLKMNRQVASKKTRPRIPYRAPPHNEEEKHFERFYRDNLGLRPEPWEDCLRSQAQWMRWIKNIQHRASFYDMWPYINPDLSEDQVEKIPQEFQGLKMPHPNDIKPDYESDDSQQRDLEETLSCLNEVIVLSLAAEYHYLIADQQSPRGKLLKLAKLFRPKPEIYRQDMRNAWRQMKRSSPSKIGVEKWTIKWTCVYEEAKAAKVPELSCGDKPAIWDFLEAVRNTGPDDKCFSRLWQQIIEEKEYSLDDVMRAYLEYHWATTDIARSIA